MKERFIDKLLNIKTDGEQKSFSDHDHYHPYEATPYSAMDTLFKEYKPKSSDHFVDFGCGKGRLNFYLNYLFNSFVTGVEQNKIYFYQAMENRNSYLSAYHKKNDKIRFENCLAEEYIIGSTENKFYFFNPFSVQIFMKVINNILISAEMNPRDLNLILYYPSEDYIYYLDSQTPFRRVKEVELPVRNVDERFLIYAL